MTSQAKNCRRCGAPIPSGRLGGNCPRCLVAGALSSTSNGAAAKQPDPTGRPAFQLERFFGDYEIISELARGGMGIVYKARQLSLNRPAALKMIGAGQFATPAQVQRFQLEAKAAARLDHPNIVPIYEVGEHEGHHFYSMKLIEGGNLAAKRQKAEGRRQRAEQNDAGQLEPRAAALLLVQVSRAVHHAHQRGVLHRDLKPTNILLDTEGNPHVADFGLAKLFDEDTNLTQTIAVLGTPAYMAPELAAGKAAQATVAADVYSLGAILYELLAGRPPFEAENVPMLLRKIIEEEAAPINSMRGAHSMIPGNQLSVMSNQFSVEQTGKIDRDLETICLKCLEKEAARRYPSAAALADDLERWLHDEPIQARPATPLERIHRWCRRQPALAAVSLALSLAILGGLVVSSLLLWREKQASRRAVFAEQRQSQLRGQAEASAADSRAAARQAQEELWRAQLAQARAERRSGEEGQRFNSLATLSRATAIHPSLELRNEAIAALALTDLRFVPVWTNPYPFLVARYSPGLRWLAVAAPDGRIELFRPSDGSLATALPAIGGVAKWLQFSSDERFLGARYTTESCRVWDLSARSQALDLGQDVLDLDFTHGSAGVLAPDRSGLIRRVSFPDGQELWRRNIGAGSWYICVQPQDKYFAAYGYKRSDVQVRDLATGQRVRTLSHRSPVGVAAWSPDGRTLFVGTETGRMTAWSMDSEAALTSWNAHDDSVAAIGVERSNHWLASGSWDRSLRLWSLPDYRLGVAAPGYDFLQCDFSTDGRWLGAGRDQALGRVEISSSDVVRPIYVPPGDERGAWSADVSPDGSVIAVGYTDGLRLLDFDTGRELAFQPFRVCRSPMFTPDGTGLLACGSSGLACWPVETTASADGSVGVRLGPRQNFGGEKEFLGGALTANGRWVAAANQAEARIEVFDVNNPTNHFSLGEHRVLQVVALSPEGRWAASATWNGHGVKIWDLLSRSPVTELPVDRTCITFSLDGRLLATTSRICQVWETGTWQEKYRTLPLGGAGAACAFSPDSSILAVGKEQRIVELMDANTGRVLADLEAPGSAPVSYLRFTPDGTQLLALRWTWDIQIWDLRRLRTELSALNLDWDAPPYPEK